MAEKRTKTHSGSEPPPPEVRDAYDEVYWEPPGADRLKYNKMTKSWDKATAPAAAKPPVAGKVQPTTIAAQGAEQTRAAAESSVQAAGAQQAVASRGELGGLGLGERAKVSAWLKQNPGKTAADARKALGLATAGTQKKALESTP